MSNSNQLETNRQESLYSIILPTYNERENLPLIFYLINETFEEMKSKSESISPNTPAPTFEVIVVEDNSPDNTLEIAQSLQKQYGDEKVQILPRKGKLGLGSAYKDGLKLCRGSYVILMDADLSHHPKFIKDMIRLMSEHNKKSGSNDKMDIVSGTRYRLGGGVAGWDWFRKLTSCTANFLAMFLLNPGPSDLTGSFRLYKREAIETILPKVISKGYAFQMEILVHARKEGMKVGEVPITFVDRIYGESKLGTAEIIMYLKGLLFLFFTT